MTKTKSFTFPRQLPASSLALSHSHTGNCCVRGSRPPLQVPPTLSHPTHIQPQPEDARGFARVNGCSAFSPRSHLSLGSPAAQMLPPRATSSRDPHTSHQHPPPAPPRHCVFHRLCCLSRFSVASTGCVYGELCLRLFRAGLCLSYCLVSLARSRVPGTW